MSINAFSISKHAQPVGYFRNWVSIICGSIIVLILILIAGWLYRQSPWNLKRALVTEDSTCNVHSDNNSKTVVCTTQVDVSKCIGDEVEKSSVKTDADAYSKGSIINVFQNPSNSSSGAFISDMDKYSYNDKGSQSHFISGILILVALVIAAGVASHYYLRDNINQQNLSALTMVGDVRKAIF